MISKIIFVLAAVCVVNASVLTVNVLDDDPGTELASNPKDCNFRACDQLCRRLKFHGGACVNGRCKCDNFFNAEDGVSEKSPSNVENPVSQEDDPEAEVAASPSRCNHKACDLVCRWLNKTSGSCVDGRCKCAKSLVAKDAVDEYSEFPIRVCRVTKCSRKCTRRGYEVAKCVAGRCKCYNKTQEKDTMTESAESLPLSSCSSTACDDKCRRTGWHSGVCIKGQCKCDYFLNTEDTVTENTLSNLEDSISPRRCTYQACNNLCRRLKFPGGTCVSGRCKCDNFFGTEDGVSEKSPSNVENPVSQEDDPEAEVAASPSRCNRKACDLVCRWLNKTSGSCVDGRCKCAKSLVAKDAVDEYSEFPINVCRLTKCSRKCTRRGYEVAKCVNGRCKCYNKTQEKDTMTESAESLPLSSCSSTACDDKCRRTGWHSGVCIKGQCKCDYFLNTEDTVTENTLSNLEDSISPRRCTYQACNNLCRRLKFPGGTCVSGRCKCDNFFGTEDGVSEKSPSNVENPVSQEDDPEAEVAASPSRCNRKACDLVCRWLNKTSGSCVDGRCKCAKSLVAKDAVDEYSEFPINVCRLTKCSRKCTRRGYEVAKCVNGRCKCYNKTQEKDTMTESAESLPLSSCSSTACDDKCRRTGWHSGVCIKGQCKCDYFLNTEDTVTENTLSNLEDSISPRRCTYQACNNLCRRLKFPGGTCVSGRCKCDNFFGTEDAVDEYSEFPIRVCRLTKCSRKCTRRGYEVAKCVNGRCKCYNKTQEKDASPLNDVISDENEESDVILSTNEEEPTIPSPRACNTVTCNQMCHRHRLNFAGGWCSQGKCRCY